MIEIQAELEDGKLVDGPSVPAVAGSAGVPVERAEAIRRRRKRLDAVFDALPTLGSADYLEHIRRSRTTSLPPEVLARAYRQLVDAGALEAAQTTRDRLLDPAHNHFEAVWRQAPKMVVNGQGVLDVEDLVYGAMARVLDVLPTPGGASAERAWRSFIVGRLIDEWRAHHGYNGEEVSAIRRRAQSTAEAGDEPGSVEYPDSAQLASDEEAEYAYWHGRADAEERTKAFTQIEHVIAQVISAFPEGSLERYIAEDRLGGDRSPINSDTRSETPRTPLTEQLGADRFQVSRASRRVRVVLAAALLTELGPDDRERLSYLIRPVRPQKKRVNQ